MSASKGGMSNKGGSSNKESASKGGMSNKGGSSNRESASKAGMAGLSGKSSASTGAGKSSAGSQASSGGSGKSSGAKSSSANKDTGFLSGIKSVGSAIAAVPGNIARDVSMGVSAGLFSNRDKQRANLKATGKYTDAQINDYFARTDATLARNAAEAAARSNRSDDSPSAITPRPQDVLPPEEQMPIYRSPFGPQAPVQQSIEITPEMRAAALRTFESQRGAGQIPYQMMPYQQGLGSMRPGASPAFQYAAQNYQRLGGSQRLMDRPIEMMSAAERRTINDMSRAMAEQAQQQQEYDMGRRLMGKGGGAVAPQPFAPNAVQPMMAASLGGGGAGLASLRPMITSGTFRRPVGTTGTFRDYIS